MRSITRKSELKKELEECLSAYYSSDINACANEVHERVLLHKVRFPLLEYSAHLLYDNLPVEEHIFFCDQIQKLKTIGGNVILGIILQRRLTDYYKQSLQKAAEYISKADIWYICDIIGERVFGYALLHEPKRTIPKVGRFLNNQNDWVIRSIGAGIHYAIKKGLDRDNVEILFELILSKANSKDKEIRQGIGWAAKTTAKFHPEIIKTHETEIQNQHKVANWFRAKITIGLKRHDYAKRNKG